MGELAPGQSWYWPGGLKEEHSSPTLLLEVARESHSSDPSACSPIQQP